MPSARRAQCKGAGNPLENQAVFGRWASLGLRKMGELDPRESEDPLQSDLRALRAENAALRARNASLEAVCEFINDAVFVRDLHGRYLTINTAGARLLGKSVEQVVGKIDTELFSPDTVNQIIESDREVITEGSTRNYERILEAAGCVRSYLTTKGPFRDDQGRVIGVIGIARDITEGKRLETERQKALERLRLQIARLPLGYIHIDANGRVVDWNPAAERLFGYDKEEAVGKPCLELIVPAPIDAHVQEIVRRIWAGDMHAHSVNENRAKDGNIITCEWFNTPLIEADGSFAGVISLAQDVTERKRAEEALARDALLLANVRDCVIVTDLEGIVTFWNEGATRLFGWRADEMVGRPMVERVPESARARMAAESQAIVLGKDFSGELEDYRKDGSRVWIDARVTRITDATGRPVGLIGLAHDITDRKLGEEALREYAERLQGLSRRVVEVQEEERRHLARELHDEIGQSLTAIGINLQAVKRSCGASMLPQLEECIGIVDSAIQQVRHLSLDLRPTMLDDLGLVSALRWYLDHQAQRVGYRARLAADADDVCVCPAIATAAFRVAQEALTNVARHARARRVNVRLRLRDGAVRLVVRDDGAGFNPKATLRRGGNGEGLGLLGMRERAALLGGRVSIHSAPGRGTEVRLIVPLEQAAKRD
jgi:PAS domain S-box-containing protein